jgi:flagellar biosynthesis regulator FlbT
MKNMKNTTTGLIENLLQSLNVKAFIKSVQEFDNVTQRQCFLKALKEIRKSNIIELHGQERVRSTVKEINNALEVEVEVT